MFRFMMYTVKQIGDWSLNKPLLFYQSINQKGLRTTAIKETRGRRQGTPYTTVL